MQIMNNIQSHIEEIKDGSIVTPIGYKAAGVHAGLRYNKKDIGAIVSAVPANCAAVYTASHFQAAPLKVTQESIAKEKRIQAIVVNSACANACTGEKGLKDAYEMRKIMATYLQIKEEYVAVSSTGVIGEYLQMDKIKEGINQLIFHSTPQNAEAFQEAILTTDTVMKKCCFSATIAGVTVTMGGTAKGSGMIHPNMATMLGFITTDAAIPSEVLQAALSKVIPTTFNQITVDGDTSTNDTVLVLANGMAKNEPLTEEHPDYPVFLELLSTTCESLAKQIAKDGEGATKLIEVRVSGSNNDEEARVIAKQIVGSNLVKTAIYGSDANWGRIITAIGQTKTAVNPSRVDIAIGDILMLKESEPQSFSEQTAIEYLNQDFIQIFVDLHNGKGEGKAWGCDLSYDYVKINASYRT
ncbi:bifunctional ornithine acetyltransferase/N-acetylglutamate synthase [Niallia circulans]|uniref:bifunctional ornithine acetyltransferase/N-acetylglutamate synthase n=2 Tax=Bacillaceae TaxID=186817 RepID=UPI000BA6E320|nr:bifunctional ornithine acetyltransferase/N-acetylglutamate synthase [Niallia circulans]PAD24882.1 bifunctional ornithine acetyltransferase/N-acetylglutamate synthase [Niallia circulans]PAD88943.1 bifunctional ornithine acetyltransferase/N-acetylglutamate synthase [Niallia circulans]